MADATHYVDPPRRDARLGGIRSVAEFRTAGARLGLGGTIEYTSPGCGIAVGDVELCYPSPAAAQAEKTRDGIDTLEGVGPVFGIYAGVECFLGGSDYIADALRLLDQGADRAVEAALNTWVTATAATGAITGFAEAVAVADNAADAEYVGRPILLMNRGDAVRAVAADALEVGSDGSIWTPNGTPVIASSAFTAGVVAVTGGITVLEGGSEAHMAQDYTFNKEYAIAERVYGIIVDCNYIDKWTVTA